MLYRPFETSPNPPHDNYIGFHMTEIENGGEPMAVLACEWRYSTFMKPIEDEDLHDIWYDPYCFTERSDPFIQMSGR